MVKDLLKEANCILEEARQKIRYVIMQSDKNISKANKETLREVLRRLK